MQNFTNWPKNVLYSSHFLNFPSRITPSKYVSLIFFNLDQSLSLSSSSQVWKVQARCFTDSLSFGLSVVFSWLDSQSSFLDDVLCDWCLSFSASLQEAYDASLVSLLILTLITWLRWYAACFPIKLHFFSFVINKKPEGDNLRLSTCAGELYKVRSSWHWDQLINLNISKETSGHH